MAKHQIIYTSCMRGITGGNDGQQIFSYDESFTGSSSEDVKGLFTYQVPSLPPGVLMSEEIAGRMPVSFMYRLLKNGNAAVTLNTYLGRDYMGSTGRFGNHLSHSIICGFSDFDIYPCEMYAGPALRSRMEFEEVNNPEPPAYLPVPELEKGCVVNPDRVIEFLGLGENMEYLKKMVTAMLRFPVEKKRIVICDEPENIVKWIAALHYTLPLDIAKQVNFTTYEYDPELSPARICGVISEGSRYHAGEYASSNRHYVFDFINDRFSGIQPAGTLMEFIDAALSFSYESLTEFHDFVIGKTTYRECGEGYYACYYLYNFFTGGLEDITLEEFKEIVGFSDGCLTEETKRELLERLTRQGEGMDKLDNEYAFNVLGFLLQSMGILNGGQRDAVKQMIVNRLIVALSAEGGSEESFIPLYDRMDRMARDVDFSIPGELMVERNKDFLLGVLEGNAEPWKVLFIVRITSEYVRDMGLSADELKPDHPMGKIYCGFVRMMYLSGKQNGRRVVERIITGFKDSGEHDVNMVLHMEGFLKELGSEDSEMGHLWEFFYGLTLAADSVFMESVNRILFENGRFHEMYQLYDRQIRKKTSLKETRDFFAGYWGKWFARDSGYRHSYAEAALKEYEALYERGKDGVSDKEIFPYASEILRLAMGMGIKEGYVDALCRTVCGLLPLENPGHDNLEIINEICRYRIETEKQPVEGKLLLFWIAIRLGKITDQKDIVPAAHGIKRVEPESGGAKLQGMGVGEIKDYFGWAFQAADKCRLTADDYTAIYELFLFDARTRKLFMDYWCRAAYQRCKADQGYRDFGEFLSFMFGVGGLDDQDMAGRYLCRLGRQKLEDLDLWMEGFFKGDKKALRAWRHVKEIAANTNPLLNNLSGLFKKKP